jgi:hypothetical protein
VVLLSVPDKSRNQVCNSPLVLPPIRQQSRKCLLSVTRQYVASFDVVPTLSRAETGLLGVTSCYPFPGCVLMDRIDGELVLQML